MQLIGFYACHIRMDYQCWVNVRLLFSYTLAPSPCPLSWHKSATLQELRHHGGMNWPCHSLLFWKLHVSRWPQGLKCQLEEWTCHLAWQRAACAVTLVFQTCLQSRTWIHKRTLSKDKGQKSMLWFRICVCIISFSSVAHAVPVSVSPIKSILLTRLKELLEFCA